MEGEEEYDEFGNYIGKDSTNALQIAETESSDFSDDEMQILDSELAQNHDHSNTQEHANSRIVLYDDKEHFPSASKVFGPNVEILVQEEDTQPLSTPIIAPESKLIHQTIHEQPLKTSYSREYILSMLHNTQRHCNIAVIGSLNHGKTSILELLVEHTHQLSSSTGIKPPKKKKSDVLFMDNLNLEQERMITIKSKAFTCLLPGGPHKTSHIFTIIDTPGHSDFNDQVQCSLDCVEGVALVVDAVEGVLPTTERLIEQVVERGLSIVLVINKLERLIVELCLPPSDTYFKILQINAMVNTKIKQSKEDLARKRDIFKITSNNSRETNFVCPREESVVFASARGGWMFTLHSFAQIYCRRTNESGTKKSTGISPKSISRQLWGQVHWDHSTGKIVKNSSNLKSTFTQFVLEPIYKIYTQIISIDSTGGNTCKQELGQLGIRFTDDRWWTESAPDVVKKAFKIFFGELEGGSVGCFADACIASVPPPSLFSSENRMNDALTPHDSCSILVRGVQPVDASCSTLYHLVRIIGSSSSSIRTNDTFYYYNYPSHSTNIRNDGNANTVDDDECVKVKVESIRLSHARYSTPINEAFAGNLVLVKFVSITGASHELTIPPCAILHSKNNRHDKHNFKQILAPAISTIQHLQSDSFFRVAIEAVNPTDQPKIMTTLKKLSLQYPSLLTKIEDNGELSLLARGELAMDCILYDLRVHCAWLRLRVSDPVCPLRESVGESSWRGAKVVSSNHLNSLEMVAEPLEPSVCKMIQSGLIGEWNAVDCCDVLTRNGWDELEIEGLMAVSESGCVLINEVIEEDEGEGEGENDCENKNLKKGTKQGQMMLIKESIDLFKQAFKWACREGPLVEGKLSAIKFKLINAHLSPHHPQTRTASQLLPIIRQACHKALLLASPRLLEPLHSSQIVLSNPTYSQAVLEAVAARRGHLINEALIGGTPFTCMTTQCPLLDMAGYCTDIKIAAQGLASVESWQSGWQMVPGDPLDESIRLVPLESAPAPLLARDYLVKTRRRRGLSDRLYIPTTDEDEDNFV